MSENADNATGYTLPGYKYLGPDENFQETKKEDEEEKIDHMAIDEDTQENQSLITSHQAHMILEKTTNLKRKEIIKRLFCTKTLVSTPISVTEEKFRETENKRKEKDHNMKMEEEALQTEDNESLMGGTNGAGDADPYTFSSDEEMEPVLRAARDTQPDRHTVAATAGKPIDNERLALFKSALQQLFREERANSLPLDRVRAYVNEKYSHATFDDQELNSALARMTKDNHVMMADDIVFLI
ncbi:hypothetical protein evm_011036 [Chilo suppressalis]|nr:hypothetical protein evm_011036 [Chilo suppressalis]